MRLEGVSTPPLASASNVCTPRSNTRSCGTHCTGKCVSSAVRPSMWVCPDPSKSEHKRPVVFQPAGVPLLISNVKSIAGSSPKPRLPQNQANNVNTDNLATSSPALSVSTSEESIAASTPPTSWCLPHKEIQKTGKHSICSTVEPILKESSDLVSANKISPVPKKLSSTSSKPFFRRSNKVCPMDSTISPGLDDGSRSTDEEVVDGIPPPPAVQNTNSKTSEQRSIKKQQRYSIEERMLSPTQGQLPTSMRECQDWRTCYQLDHVDERKSVPESSDSTSGLVVGDKDVVLTSSAEFSMTKAKPNSEKPTSVCNSHPLNDFKQIWLAREKKLRDACGTNCSPKISHSQNVSPEKSKRIALHLHRQIKDGNSIWKISDESRLVIRRNKTRNSLNEQRRIRRGMWMLLYGRKNRQRKLSRSGCRLDHHHDNQDDEGVGCSGIKHVEDSFSARLDKENRFQDFKDVMGRDSSVQPNVEDDCRKQESQVMEITCGQNDQLASGFMRDVITFTPRDEKIRLLKQKLMNSQKALEKIRNDRTTS